MFKFEDVERRFPYLSVRVYKLFDRVFTRRRPCLQGGDHVSDGVGECGVAMEIGLPIAREQLEIIFPAASVEAFALGIRSVFAGGFGAAGSGAEVSVHDRLDELPGGVEDQRLRGVTGSGGFA